MTVLFKIDKIMSETPPSVSLVKARLVPASLFFIVGPYVYATRPPTPLTPALIKNLHGRFCK